MKEKFIAILITALFAIAILSRFFVTVDAPKIDNGDTSIDTPTIISRFNKKHTKPGIAVVHLYGAITTQGQTGLMGIPRGGADAVVRRLTQLRDDNLVKAVVLRINSPGGTVGASQELNAAVEKLREAGKPVVVSVADIAASGGYYTAVAATEIYANKGSLVGSIGVIMSLPPGMKGLLEWAKLDTKGRVFTSGKFKDLGSVYRDMLPAEQELLQKLIDNTYQQFLAAVIKGRKNMKPSDVRELAQGQIYTGLQAMELGLIDHLGTFEDAVLRAGVLGGIKGKPTIIQDKSNQFSVIFDQMSMRFLNSSNSNPMTSAIEDATKFRLEYRFQPGLGIQ